jgi:hypothetical protein
VASLLAFAELISSNLKMEAICSSETSVETRRTIRRHIPEDDTLHNFDVLTARTVKSGGLTSTYATIFKEHNTVPCKAIGIASFCIFDGDFHFNSSQASHKTSTIPFWKRNNTVNTPKITLQVA